MRDLRLQHTVTKMNPVEMWSFERLTRFPR